MCSAEGGKEVVQSIFVQQIYDGESNAPLVFVAVEYVVMPDGQIKEIARGDARGIVIVVLSAGSGDA